MEQREMILPIWHGPIAEYIDEKLQNKTFRFGDDQIELIPSGSFETTSFRVVRIDSDGSKHSERNGADALSFQYHARPQGKTKMRGYCTDNRLLPEFDRVWKLIKTEFQAENESPAINIPDTRVAQIREWVKEGLSDLQIGHKLVISDSRVKQIRLANGLKRRARGKRLS